MEVLDHLAVRKLRVVQSLRQRVQQPGEACTSYIQDVEELCARVSPSVVEEDKIKHLIEGVEECASPNAARHELSRGPRHSSPEIL